MPDNAGRMSRNLLMSSIISGCYILLSYFLIGFKSEQVVLVGLFMTMFNLSEGTRRFISGFSIFIVFWVIFDYMKAFPNYHYREVNIEGLYNLEKSLFGFFFQGKLLTPNEYFVLHGNRFLDALSGIFYLTWVPVPLMFAVFLFFKNRTEYFYFALTFLFINLTGFVVYYIYPAAPPWYVQLYGFDFRFSTPGNTAGLARFDHLFGVEIFKSIYAKSSNVFAAMPSLHSSYPVLIFYYALKNRWKKLAAVFFVIMAGIWFSAVYNSHHYILDVLAGITTALVCIYVFDSFLKHKTWLKSLIRKLDKASF